MTSKMRRRIISERRPQLLLARVRDLLATLPTPRLAPFLALWPDSAARATVPTSLPVLQQLPALAACAPHFANAVTDALCRLAGSLTWSRSYSQETMGAAFFANYGWTEIAGLTGPIPSRCLAVGFLVLGPATLYPRHRHEAEEIYLPLVGTAEWCGGDGVWAEQAPGAVIVHERDEPHATRTTTDALLALYLWRSDNLEQRSRLDPQG